MVLDVLPETLEDQVLNHVRKNYAALRDRFIDTDGPRFYQISGVLLEIAPYIGERDLDTFMALYGRLKKDFPESNIPAHLPSIVRAAATLYIKNFPQRPKN